jgi:hypothetical protein
MFCVLFMCKCVLPPGVNPIAVDKYIRYQYRSLPYEKSTVFSKSISLQGVNWCSLSLFLNATHYLLTSSPSSFRSFYPSVSFNNTDFLFSAPSLNLQYPLFSLMPPSICLGLLPRLSVPSILPSPSITQIFCLVLPLSIYSTRSFP